MRQLRGAPGRRTGEILWRAFPYPVREAEGLWHLDLYGAPIARRARIRIPPPPGRTRGRWVSLIFVPVRQSRRGLRRDTAGYVWVRGQLWRVRVRPGGRLERAGRCRA